MLGSLAVTPAQERIDWFSDAKLDLDIDLPEETFATSPTEGTLAEPELTDQLIEQCQPRVSKFLTDTVQRLCDRTQMHAHSFLTEAQGTALRKLQISIVDQTLTDWHEQIRTWMLRRTSEQAHSTCNHFLHDPPVAWADPWDARCETRWREGIATIFSVEELSHLRAISDRFRQRRRDAIAQYMLFEMEHLIGISTQQAEVLNEHSEALLYDLPKRCFRPSQGSSHYTIDPNHLKSAFERPLVKLVLDAGQWERWLKIDPDQLATFGNPSTIPVAVSPSATSQEANDIYEDIRSQILQWHWEPKAQQIARAIPLPNHVKEQLRTAAKGTAQLIANQLMDDVEFRIRSHWDKHAAQRKTNSRVLINLPFPTESSLWEEALEKLLTEDQRAQIAKLTKDTPTRRAAIIAELTLTEIERFAFIDDASRSALKEALQEIIATNSQVFTAYARYWHLRTGTLGLPLLKLDPDVLGSLLSQEALEAIEGPMLRDLRRGMQL